MPGLTTTENQSSIKRLASIKRWLAKKIFLGSFFYFLIVSDLMALEISDTTFECASMFLKLRLVRSSEAIKKQRF